MYLNNTCTPSLLWKRTHECILQSICSPQRRKRQHAITSKLAKRGHGKQPPLRRQIARFLCFEEGTIKKSQRKYIHKHQEDCEIFPFMRLSLKKVIKYSIGKKELNTYGEISVPSHGSTVNLILSWSFFILSFYLSLTMKNSKS